MAADPADSASGIQILGVAQHAAWQRRTLPPVERVAGGLWSVPVPIPNNPLRYTLCYLVAGTDGVVVVDPGWDDDHGWAVLLAGLADAGIGVTDVIGVVATHVHPDHHGLSGRLREASGAWVAMHPAEQATLPLRLEELTPEELARHAPVDLIAAGVPAEEMALLRRRFEAGETPKVTDMVQPDVLLEDDDLVPLKGRRLRAVWTPGHTPGHLCLREPDARVLLTGDHVLPRITPNIGLLPQGGEAPLRHFLASLDKVAAYDDHDALPAHEYRFHGLAVRTRQLQEHHAHRCAELLTVVDELGRPTLWQLAEQLTWSRPWAEVGTMRVAALAETAAHANHLVEQGALAWDRYPDRRPAQLRRVD